MMLILVRHVCTTRVKEDEHDFLKYLAPHTLVWGPSSALAQAHVCTDVVAAGKMLEYLFIYEILDI
jgi:hypothetical protein